jgi:hypothetical protein
VERFIVAYYRIDGGPYRAVILDFPTEAVDGGTHAALTERASAVVARHRRAPFRIELVDMAAHCAGDAALIDFSAYWEARAAARRGALNRGQGRDGRHTARPVLAHVRSLAGGDPSRALVAASLSDAPSSPPPTSPAAEARARRRSHISSLHPFAPRRNGAPLTVAR